MRVDQDTCIGCGECLPYCPVGVISLVDGVAVADQDGCVECRVCTRAFSCPTDANLVNRAIEDIKAGRTTAAAAAKEIARPCACGCFNTTRAAELLQKAASA